MISNSRTLLTGAERLDIAVGACLAATEAILRDVGMRPAVVINFAWCGEDGIYRTAASNVPECDEGERKGLISSLRMSADELEE